MDQLLVTITDAEVAEPTTDHSFLVKYQAACGPEQIHQTSYSKRWVTGATAWKNSLMQFRLGKNWTSEVIMIQVISASGGGTTVGFGDLALRDLATNPAQDKWVHVQQHKVLVTLQYLGEAAAPPPLPAAIAHQVPHVPSHVPMAEATVASGSATAVATATVPTPSTPPPAYTVTQHVPPIPPPAPAPAPAPAPTAEPTVFDNKYRELKQLGKGNFGTVYRAKCDVDDQVYAIKLIRIKTEKDKKAIREEAKVLFSLYNSHIVRYFTSFLHGPPEKQHYGVVMEFCDGGTLEEQVKSGAKSGIALPDADITLWIYQISKALEYLHGKGMMHRDLKCDNVMLRGGVAKLADFGLASTRQSITGQVGALAYESPEQARHEEYDGRNDVWALGCVVSELTTLKFVWRRIKQREVFASNRAVVKQTLDEVNQRSSAWANFTNWLLTFDKTRRPKSDKVLAYLQPAEAEVRRLISAGHHASSFIFKDRATSAATPSAAPHAQPHPHVPQTPPRSQTTIHNNISHSHSQNPAYSHSQTPTYSHAQTPTYSHAQTPTYSPAQTMTHSHSQPIPQRSHPVQNNQPKPSYSLPPNWEEDVSLKLMMFYSAVDPSQTDTITSTLKSLREGRMSFNELSNHLRARYHRPIDLPNIAERVVISHRKPAAPSYLTMDFTLPAGAVPGMPLQVMAPNGKKFIIKVPAGYSAGMRLAVQYEA